MRRHVTIVLTPLLFLAASVVSSAQVIARARGSEEVIRREPPKPDDWGPALRKAWEYSQRLDVSDGAGFSLRQAICELLADQGQFSQAVAVAVDLTGLHKCLVEGFLARRAAEHGDLKLARQLYGDARQGGHFLDVAGIGQLNAVLAGAASALKWQEEVDRLLKETNDPEHLVTAIGAALAASHDRLVTSESTQALVDQLIAEDQEKFFIARVYQAKAILEVAQSWQQSPEGLEAEVALAFCRRAVRFADNKLVYADGFIVDAAEICQKAGLLQEAEGMLWKAREKIAEGGGFEHGPADVIELARVWRLVTGDDIGAKMATSAWDRLELLEPVLKAEAAILLGGALWRSGDLRSAREAWLKAAKAVSKSPNEHWTNETLAGIAIEAARCGADRGNDWGETIADIEVAAGLPGKEGA